MPPGPFAGNRNRPAYSGQPRYRFPKQIIQLFAPRKPLEFKPPPRKRRLRPMTGIAAFTSKFDSTPKQAIQAKPENDKAKPKFETPAQRRRCKKQERLRTVAEIVAARRAEWDPHADGPDVEKTKQPYSTLFVNNIPRTTLELTLQEEFEQYGPVRTVIMPKDRDGVPRGYAFIEFQRERDASVAAWQAKTSLRIEGRRLGVDVERGRTVKGWLPNRLDGPNNICATGATKRKPR